MVRRTPKAGPKPKRKKTGRVASRAITAGRNRKAAPPALEIGSVRSRLVLQGSAHARFVQRRPDCVVPNPSRATDVLDAFAAIGIEGPYCEFLRREPTTEAAFKDLSKRIRAARNGSAAVRVASKWHADRWFRVDENAVEWNHIVPTRSVRVVPTGLLVPTPFDTQCGRVEQWLALAFYFTSQLAAFRRYGGQSGGFLHPGCEITSEHLVIGITNGPPVVAAARPEEMQPQSRTPAKSTPSERELTTAGLALLVWAEAQTRLQRMFDQVHDVHTRLRLRAIAQFLARRTPLLEWTELDFELLKDVRTELCAAAPIWKGRPGKGVATDSPNPLQRIQWIRSDEASKRSGLSADTLSKRAQREKWETTLSGRMRCYQLTDLERAYPHKKFQADSSGI